MLLVLNLHMVAFGGVQLPNPSHRIRDRKTKKEYPAKAALGRDLAHLVGGDPRDQFVFFKLAAAYPERFEVLNAAGRWVSLDDPSAPVGTLRPRDAPLAGEPPAVRTTTLAIDERKYEQVRAVLGTATLRDTVDRSFDEVLVRAARMKDVEDLRTMRGLDLDKPSVMRDAWR